MLKLNAHTLPLPPTLFSHILRTFEYIIELSSMLEEVERKERFLLNMSICSDVVEQVSFYPPLTSCQKLFSSNLSLQYAKNKKRTKCGSSDVLKQQKIQGKHSFLGLLQQRKQKNSKELGNMKGREEEKHIPTISCFRIFSLYAHCTWNLIIVHAHQFELDFYYFSSLFPPNMKNKCNSIPCTFSPNGFVFATF